MEIKHNASTDRRKIWRVPCAGWVHSSGIPLAFTGIRKTFPFLTVDTVYQCIPFEHQSSVSLSHETTRSYYFKSVSLQFPYCFLQTCVFELKRRLVQLSWTETIKCPRQVPIIKCAYRITSGNIISKDCRITFCIPNTFFYNYIYLWRIVWWFHTGIQCTMIKQNNLYFFFLDDLFFEFGTLKQFSASFS